MKFAAFRRNTSAKPAGTDKPIIHQSVPDEVLYPDGKPEAATDMSWFDTIPLGEAKAPEKKEVFVSSQAKPERAKSPMFKPNLEVRAKTEPLVLAESHVAPAAPNGEASARPPHPVGWLVVVEGPGTGQWFVLENGTSHIGQAADQTVRLDFGDETVVAAQHAALTYDDTCHGFFLDGHADKVRLNGKPVTTRAAMRDGDVFSVGQTSLRLVALCTPNFHW